MLESPSGRMRTLLVAFGALAVCATMLQRSSAQPSTDSGVPLFEMMASPRSMAPRQKEMMSLDMNSASTMGASLARIKDVAVVEGAMMRGMEGGHPPPVLQVPLSPTMSVAVRRTSVTKNTDNLVWRGEVDGSGEPVTLMWWPDGHVSGTIRHAGRVFTVKSAGGGMHEIVETAPLMLPPDHAPASRELLSRMGMASDPLVGQGDASMMRSMMEKAGMMPVPPGPHPREDVGKLRDASRALPADGVLRQTARPRIDQSPSRGGPLEDEITITLLVAYTPAVASRYEHPVRDLVALAVEEANQSFRNSGLGHIRLQLAHAYQTDYVESGSHFEHVWRFADRGDGFMDEVHALRDKYKADVALLMVHDPMGCGLATRVSGDAEEAFAVVHHECATSMYSLAHEIGHIIGARHDYALDATATPYPFGHGYVHGTLWRTMMSYKDTCNDCPRLPVWSSPRVTVRGVAAGSERHDNARVIAAGAARVAGFR